jgi:hypothetical protein
MPMYFPEWTKHSIENSTDAVLKMECEDFYAKVYIGFYAEVEAEWSVYSFNQYDPEDFPEPPTLTDYTIEDITIYINGDEAFPGDTLYEFAHSWAMDQIKYYEYEADDVPMEGREEDV